MNPNHMPINTQRDPVEESLAEIKDGGSAFPIGILPGMTLRDCFAAKAMQGLIAACANESTAAWEAVRSASDRDETALLSYQMADAMLKAREA